ncbi:MAG: ParB/RepB/Spo0J family partition protein [Planctomycetota bacterium]|jgi:ParB family chromosome partitioning protein
MQPTKFQYKPIPMENIEVSPENARKEDVDEGLDELVRSIDEIGLQQPIVVYKHKGRFRVLIGQRRFLAFKRLGLEEIPALVRSIHDKTQAAILSFSENIQRLDLGYRDKMRVAVLLLKELKTVAKVAERLGVSPQTVRNWLGYAGVPEGLKKLVDQGKISPTTARQISRSVPDERKAVEIARRVKEEPTSDRRTMLIDTARQNPGKSVRVIADLAKKQKYSKVTLNLTPRLAGALEAACRDYDSERSDIATAALEEWLGKRGFLK